MIRRTLLLFPAVLCMTISLTAADSVIKGTVTDATGKPVRGALVKAAAGTKTITRFSQKDGRYQITLPAGTYDVSAEAYGFDQKTLSKDTDQIGETNFTLSPRWDVTRLTGADITGLLPDDAPAQMVKSICINCHSFDVILKLRGNRAEDWKNFFPTMALRMGGGGLRFNDAKMGILTAELEKLFGPDAKYFGPDAAPPAREQVKHPELSDEVLKATFSEYRLPSAQSMPHSLTVDPKGEVWVAGYDIGTNAVVRFSPATEKFQIYPLEDPHSVPHTPCVGNNGQAWMALNGGQEAKLATVDPKTDQLQEIKWVGTKRAGVHNCSMDKAGNIWMATLGEKNEFYVYDAEKKEFRSYKYPLPASYPEESKAVIEHAPGEPPLGDVRSGSYDVKVDSKGKVWLSLYTLGWIVSYDPATGETAEFKPPHTPSIRGILVDSHDNVWFGAYNSHKLGKLDQKTGKITLYQPPTPNAAPYGLAEDKRTGYIWFPDMNGNNIDRFDPKTETFVEYPIPSRSSFPRLGIGVDPKGRVWFTEWLNPKIGVLDPGNVDNATVAK